MSDEKVKIVKINNLDEKKKIIPDTSTIKITTEKINDINSDSNEDKSIEELEKKSSEDSEKSSEKSVESSSDSDDNNDTESSSSHSDKLDITKIEYDDSENNDNKTDTSGSTYDILSKDPLFMVLSEFFMSKNGENICDILGKMNDNLVKLLKI